MKTKDELNKQYDDLLKELGSWMVNAVLANKVLSKKHQEALQIQLQLTELDEAERSPTLPPDAPTENASESILEPPNTNENLNALFNNRGFYEERFEKVK